MRRPLVSYSRDGHDPWAAKIVDDRPPAAPSRPQFLGAAAATLGALLIAGFVFGREPAVAAVPDLAGLYAALGLPVNLDVLAVEGLLVERGVDAAQLTISGGIVNRSGAPRALPRLELTLSDRAGRVLARQVFEPAGAEIAGRSTIAFRFPADDVMDAAGAALRFRGAN